MSQTFADYVLSIAGSVEESSEFPQVHVSDDGDCVEIFITKDSYYAERFDGLVTVYLSQTEENGEKRIVGALIKNIKSFICQMAKEMPGFRFECEHGELPLKYLLTAISWKQTERTDIVLKLREIVATNEITRDRTIPSNLAPA
ncbi:MAG: hypothetical protein WDZ51_09000 [Pirellulaceae bacterium]